VAYCTLGTNFLPENRASESQPPCPTSMYLINTLGWRWARRELSEQPQKEHVEHRIERQKWQRAKMAFEQGARAAVGARLFALARRGAIGGTSGSRPPRSPYVGVLPKVAVGGWRWGKWWEMSKGPRGTMAGAHLGGRGAGRRRSCSATAAPREGGRRRGHADGRHHPRSVARLFSPFLPTILGRNFTIVFMHMDQTEPF
jgi:hypothetical protein